MGELQAARQSLNEAESILPEEGLRLLAPFLLPMGLAELALAEGDVDGAGEVMRTYLTFLEDHRARAFLPEALGLSAEVHRRLGRELDARRDLERAYETALDMGSRRVLGSLARALARVAVDQAPAWQTRSQEATNYIASHIADETSRQRFLQSSLGK